MFIIIAILLFGILIAIHELGHFAAAKALNVRVLEFAIGMGPRIFKKQGRETLYCLRLFPIGGFCAMEGEDEESSDPRGFSNQRRWKRLVILVAGAAMNFLFGFVLVLIVFSQAEGFTTPAITGFYQGCPYEGADKLMVGDVIHKVNGERMYFSSNVSLFMSRARGDHVDLVVIRDGEKVRLDNFYMPLREYQENGETVTRYGLYFGVKETGALSRLKYSWFGTLDFVRLIRISLVDLLTGAAGLRDLSGPVGIVSLINTVGQSSPTFTDALLDIANLGAFISVNLAVFNLLPIPALDGGRVLFMLVTWAFEGLTRRKLNPRYEGYVHGAFLALLLGLSALVLINDILRIASV